MPAIRQPSVGLHYRDAPQIERAGSASWVVRGGNFAVVYTRAQAGARIAQDFVDESFLYRVDGRMRVRAGDESVDMAGEALTLVPPGESLIEVIDAGEFIQVVTEREGVVAHAANADIYRDGAPELTGPVEWPMPVDGYHLRGYRMADIYASGGMVNAFRTRKLMIVPYARFLEPRDETALTPHSHADFEQASVALEGDWIHHLRVPWTADRRDWRADQQLELASPSTTIIPAGMIHTSQGVAGEGMRLVDVFSPPRVDFSSRPGIVRNAADYPMPAELAQIDA